MLSSGPRTAPSACLRCQLRQVIFGRTEARVASGRAFTTAPIRHDQSPAKPDETPALRRFKGTYTIRPGENGGRIVGRPGRRQQQQSKKLLINSLGKPAEVILMEDVEEPVIAKPKATAAKETEDEAGLTAETIEAAIAEDGCAPEQEEINASLEAMKPVNSVLANHAQFKKLSKTLMDSFNVRQLANYLVQHVRNPDEPSRSAGARTKFSKLKVSAAPWKKGKTPLEKRHSPPALQKNEIGRTKVRVVEQIIRSAWRVTIHSEEQEIGELEMKLKPWQLHLLFDVSQAGASNLDKFVSAPFLLRAAEIVPYRPDNIMRITARRQDAEEIAKRLVEGLSHVVRLEMDLTTLTPILGGNARKMQAQLDKEDIRYISESTGAHIEVDFSKKVSILRIYHTNNRGAYNARRLLLTLLDIPDSADRDGNLGILRIQNAKYAASKEQIAPLSLQFSAMNIHRRYRSLQLHRIVSPSFRMSQALNTGAPEIKRRKHDINKKLTKPGEMTASSSLALDAGQWTRRPEDEDNSWTASLCLLGSTNPQHPVSAKQLNAAGADIPVKIHHVPASTNVLSYFVPKSPTENGDGSGLHLVASFSPSPFSKKGSKPLKDLPHVQLKFKMSRSTDGDGAGTRKLQLVGMSAVLKRQTLDALLADDASDLTFTRSITMDVRYSQLGQDENIQEFTARLQESLDSVSGYLHGQPDITFKMPASLALIGNKELGKDTQKPDVPVEYVLSHFEQVQEMDFVPSSEKKALGLAGTAPGAAFKRWPKNIVLRRREVDAGAFGGKRTELILTKTKTEQSAEATEIAELSQDLEKIAMLPAVTAKKERGLSKEEETKLRLATMAADTEAIVNTAVDLVDLITRSSHGKLKAPEEKASETNESQASESQASESQTEEESS